VHDAQFLQAVFSENLHLSILQRMGDVLEIMLSLDQMTVEDLHLIWGCVQVRIFMSSHVYKYQICINSARINTCP
jgi:hypothetical protein